MKADINYIKKKKEETIPLNGRMTVLSMDEAFLNQLNEEIEKNIQNEQFTVEELANSVAYSRSQLHRKVHKITGQSISQYIRNTRLKHGMDLLEQNAGTVSEIAFKIGFNSSTYFIKCFSERYGISPGEVRKGPQVHQPVNNKSGANQFDALNPATSEGLIRELFEHLLLFKPDLVEFIEGEEGGQVEADIRVLAFQIIKSFPWPIAIELRRLFSAAMKQADYKRLLQLRKAISKIIDFLSYILVSELMDELHRNTLSENLKTACYKCLNSIDLNAQLNLFRTAAPFLSSRAVMSFTKELESFFDEAFFRELEQWSKSEQNTEEIDISESCLMLEQSLIFFIKKAAFLTRYQLVNVSSIKVSKHKYKNPVFKHELHVLNSIDANFQIREETLEHFSDSNAVLLIKKIREPDQFLNLSPFVVDTHSEAIPERITGKRVKRDIFLFREYKDGQLHYTGSETTGPADLSSLENYPLLVQSLEDAIKLVNS